MPRVASPKRSWQRRSADRPRELADAALRLFAERGFDGTTIEDIAHAARVTVGTVYRYFPDKAGLLAELVHQAATPLVDLSPVAELRQALLAIWNASRATPHAEILRILVAERGRHPALADLYSRQALEPVVAQLAARPEFAVRPEPVLDARAVVGQTLGASLLAGWPPHVPPLLAQLAPHTITIDRILAGAANLATASPRRPAPDPPPVGPEAW